MILCVGASSIGGWKQGKTGGKIVKEGERKRVRRSEKDKGRKEKIRVAST